MIDLPSSWKEASLGRVTAEIGYGFTTPSTTSGHHPKLLRITDIQDDRVDWKLVPRCTSSAPDGFDLAAGDIVVARTGATVGKSFLIKNVPERAVFASYLIRIRTAAGIDPRYIWEFMRSNDYWSQVQIVAKGTAQPGANATILSSLKLQIPPAAEQRRIVAKIDRLSARSRRARDELEDVDVLTNKLKQATLETYLIGLTKTCSLSSLEAQLEVLTSGSRDWAKYYDRGSSVFVLAGNLRPLAFDPKPKRMVDVPLEGADARRSRIQINDLLVTIVGAGTGDLCRVDHQVKDYFVCQSVALLRLKRPDLSALYTYWFNSDVFGRGDFRTAMYGAARPHLSFEQLKAFRVPNPTSVEAREVVRRIEHAFAAIDRFAAEAQTARALLEKLDQAILAKAFRGELVPQDPDDEPASVLLERIRAERAAEPTKARGRRKAS